MADDTDIDDLTPGTTRAIGRDASDRAEQGTVLVERAKAVGVVAAAALALGALALVAWVVATSGPHPPAPLSDRATVTIAVLLVLPLVVWAVVARRPGR